MNWNKINIRAVLEVLRVLEKKSLTIGLPHSIVYSDGYEELTIGYKVLKEKK